MAASVTVAVTVITRRSIAGAVAGVLLGFHPYLIPLYFSMAFFYDVLAVILTSAFLIAYIYTRARGWWTWSIPILFLVFALETKEISISAVGMVAMYELLLVPERRWRLLAVCSSIAMIFAAGRLLDANSNANLNAEYQVHPSASLFAARLGHWTYEAFNRVPPGSTTLVGVLALLCLLTIAWTFRKHRIIPWCVGSFLIGILPVAFISQRQLDAITVPSIALLALIGFGVSQMPSRLALTALAGILLLQGLPASRAAQWKFRQADVNITQVIQRTQTLSPRPTDDEHIVIESDPFEEMEWASTFVFHLALNMPDLSVHRRSQVTDDQLKEFQKNRFLHWDGDRWIERTP